MYESYYRFSEKPFQLNPDPAFFFGSRGHRRALAYLEYGLHQSEGFIVITGEIGAGKTTLVRSLLEQLDSNKVVAAHLVSTQIDADDMLRVVAAAFGLAPRNLDKAGLLLAIETFLTAQAAAGKRTLLIVDEAQNLTPAALEELRMLSNFQLEAHALLQSFLVGQPEFRHVMQSPEMKQFRQRVIASYHLGPLDEEETQAYIEHRLRHVGWVDDPVFTLACFAAIYAHTMGIPRRINTLCDRLLLAGFLAERHVLDEPEVQAVIEEIQSEFQVPENHIGTSVHTAATQVIQALDHSTLDLSPLANIPSALKEQVAALAVNFDVQRFEERLTRVEQSVSMTLNILNQILQAVQRDSSAKDPNQ